VSASQVCIIIGLVVRDCLRFRSYCELYGEIVCVLEAIAARSAGLRTALVVREGNAPLSEDNKALFPVIHSFDQLFTTATS